MGLGHNQESSAQVIDETVCAPRSAEEIAKEFCCRVERRDIAGVLDLLSPTVSWKIPGPPVIPYAGTFQGKDGVAEFFRVLFEHEDLQSFVSREIIVDERLGVVCVLGSENGTAIKTGKHFSAHWAELFWIKDGLITAFEEHIDTFALAEAYR